MESNKKGKISLSIVIALILFAVILIVAAAILHIQKENEEKKQNAVFNSYEIGELTLESNHLFDEYVKKEHKRKAKIVSDRITDLVNLNEFEYSVTHISMWDASALSSEWYEHYFGQPIVYNSYHVKTPQELSMYFNTILNSGNQIKEIYIDIDPYKLYQEYYKYVYYDSECSTYEEYLTNEVFKYISDNPDVKFTFILPIKPVKYWASMESTEIEKIMNNWYSFVMYLRWWENAEVAYMGSEEWIIANNNAFKDEYTLVDDACEQVYLYLYAFYEYRITPPELEQKKALIQAIAAAERNGTYHYDGYEGKKLVFYGDSIFAYAQQASFTIPGYISSMVDGDVYNLACGGTSGSNDGENNFPTVAGTGLGMDADRFEAEVSSDDEIVFIITYGMNDYFRGLKTTSLTAGLNKGIKTLKEKYPNSTFVVVGQYTVGQGNCGTEKNSADGGTLNEYIAAAKAAAGESGALFINLGKELGINSDNYIGYLADSVHPTYLTSLCMARVIMNAIQAANE